MSLVYGVGRTGYGLTFCRVGEELIGGIGGTVFITGDQSLMRSLAHYFVGLVLASAGYIAKM